MSVIKKSIVVLNIIFFSFILGYFVKSIMHSETGWEKFNSKKWIHFRTGQYDDNEYRKRMKYDLVYNVLKTNVKQNPTTYKEIVKLLGKSYEIVDSGSFSFTMSYEVEEKYGWNIDPEGYTRLELTINKEDSTLGQWYLKDVLFEP